VVLLAQLAGLVVAAAEIATVPRSVALPGGGALDFIWVPPGSFWRGSDADEPGRDADECPRHRVVLSRGFFLGVHEVTQAQWTAVIGRNPAVFRHGPEAPRRPVESISWDDCQEFIARLAAIGVGRFRLPTEAEWEYAARAGSTTRFPWGDDLEGFATHRYAWANSRSMAVTHPVGGKLPNAWGFHDLLGNVWEWCADWYGPYMAGEQTDPMGPAAGRERVFRGGSWFDFPPSLRCANRHRHPPDGRYAAVGLRLVWEPEVRP
jgi:formylglycine-generating enzyme required for sulfatase activity